MMSCGNKLYDIPPFSGEISWALLGVSPYNIGKYDNIAQEITAVHFYYKPKQMTAFPIIENHISHTPCLSLNNKSDIKSFVNKIRDSRRLEKNDVTVNGTLHIVVEFNEKIEEKAYFIVYLSQKHIAPIFKHDSAGLNCEIFVEWLIINHSQIFNPERD